MSNGKTLMSIKDLSVIPHVKAKNPKRTADGCGGVASESRASDKPSKGHDATKRSNARKGLAFQDDVIATSSHRPGLYIVYTGIPMRYSGQCPSRPNMAHWVFTKKAHVDVIATTRYWSAHIELKVTQKDSWEWDERLMNHQSQNLRKIVSDGIFGGVIVRYAAEGLRARHFVIPWDAQDLDTLNGSPWDTLSQRGYEIASLHHWIDVVESWYAMSQEDE